MSRYDNTKRNQYNSTPRKVFDTHVDRLAVRRTRDLENQRADYQLLIKLVQELREDLELIREHVAKHCHVIGGDDTTDNDPEMSGREGL